MKSQRKSILIGSNGYIGRHLAYFLDKEGYINKNYDLAELPPDGIANYEPFDLTNTWHFSKLDPDVDFIFLFAGLSGTIAGFDNYKKFIEVNEIGVLNLLNWMRITKSQARIVFPSSRLVYKGNKNTPLNEDAEKEAKTIYAKNKFSAEHFFYIHHLEYGLKYTVFRICVPYGNIFSNEYSYGTTGFFLNKARKGEDIVLFGNGENRRTFTYIEDICQIILNAIENENSVNEIYNIGGENLSLYEYAKMLAQKFSVNIKFEEWPDKLLKIETGDTVFDASKIEKILVYSYKESVKNWISKL
jgi:UDP-glucose 4-epimerase